MATWPTQHVDGHEFGRTVGQSDLPGVAPAALLDGPQQILDVTIPNFQDHTQHHAID